MIYQPSEAKIAYDKYHRSFMVCGAAAHEGAYQIAHSLLEDSLKIENDQKNDEFQIKLDDSMITSLMLNDIFFVSAVDNFNCYLSEIIILILNVDPRPIYGKKIDAKLAFSISDIQSLRQEFIDMKVLELGYQKIDELSDFLLKNFEISALSNRLTSLRLNRIVQVRNIISHNRGVANRLFMERSASKTDHIGTHVKAGHAIRAASYLETLIEKIDREAVSKFEINGDSLA